ncbi:hypothetical protein [Halovivax sp.]|uniref:hypothetical protein n=1 Tax=Halovivax sp. TaxID=1935978 RepID=UPI0025B8B84C|nr:hypothetical protein [Halovivax sp.]
MSNEIERSASSLAAVAADGDLDRVRIAAVEEAANDVDVVLELPSCDRFVHTFEKPPVWGANCDLERLLSALDADREHLRGLVDERVPCRRRVESGSLEVEIDVDELAADDATRALTPSDFGDLEL